ncbi:cytochrome b561 [Ciceribacter lividus]|uniref:Cytochrome b561 n=1 Tax=Ciceribacter lividus TaxID=1197950 RepID=A0A6I7HMN5_9HYPH|nr:cytochrome b [Ciceribacter lividus]RCW25954.1 cytochrome b561 [Ciceribacter lividus]
MTSSPVISYSLSQRLIHWIMAALILFNLLFTEGMEELTEAAEEGQAVTPDMIASANIHAYVGIVVLCLAVIRLILRFTQGVPAAPADETPLAQMASKVTHATFYLLFFVMPIAGIAAYYFDIETAGFLHAGPLKLLMWVLIVLHVGAVLVHQFVWKTPVAQRMIKG